MIPQPDSAMNPLPEPEQFLSLFSITLEHYNSWLTEFMKRNYRSERTQHAYARHLIRFMTFMLGNNLTFTRQTVQSWISQKREAGLSASSINQSLAAVKKLAYEARYSPSQAIPDEVYRAIEDIPAEKKQGRKTGKWLTIEQVTQLLHSIPMDLTGRRDRAILAVLIGCALRRDELLKLTPSQIQQREGRWVFADVLGKGSKYRTVPIPNGVKARIDEWLEYAGLPEHYVDSRPIFRPVQRGGLIAIDDRPLSDSALSYIVRTRCEKAGLGKLAPHDLRRTFARIVGGIQNLQQTPADSFETDWGQK